MIIIILVCDLMRLVFRSSDFNSFLHFYSKFGFMGKDIVRVTKRFSFEMAHALYNYDGDCRYIHGHSYKLFVTLMGSVKNEPSAPKDGMVCDFSILKKIVKEKVIDVFDHALVLNEDDQDKVLLLSTELKTILIKDQPTCENLLLYFKEEIINEIPSNLSLANIKLFETEDSNAEWDFRDQNL